MVITAAQSTTRTNTGMTCYRYQGHLTREFNRWRVHICCCWCNKEEHIARDCSGNKAGDKDINISLFPKHFDEMLPVSYVCQQITAFDTPWLRLFPDCSKRLCSTWMRKRVLATTINGETLACCGIGTVGITTESRNSNEVDTVLLLSTRTQDAAHRWI